VPGPGECDPKEACGSFFIIAELRILPLESVPKEKEEDLWYLIS
jgi:hypothetical protein